MSKTGALKDKKNPRVCLSIPEDPMKDSVTQHFKFMQALMKVENSIKSGYNAELDTWSPHPSPEGGLPTLGYGHKLEQRDIDNGDILVNGRFEPVWGLPDDMVIALFHADVKEAEDRAANEWNQHRPSHGLTWEWLPIKYRCVLTNLVFNLGSLAPGGNLKWPSLFKGIANGYDLEVRRQMVTSYKRPDGVRVKLTKRADQIADAVGLSAS